MKAVIVLEVPREDIDRFLVEMYTGEADDVAPEALDWFRTRVELLAEDEIPCAILFSMPNAEVRVERVEP